jgi:hypothetical protein
MSAIAITDDDSDEQDAIDLVRHFRENPPLVRRRRRSLSHLLLPSTSLNARRGIQLRVAITEYR